MKEHSLEACPRVSLRLKLRHEFFKGQARLRILYHPVFYSLFYFIYIPQLRFWRGKKLILKQGPIILPPVESTKLSFISFQFLHRTGRKIRFDLVVPFGTEYTFANAGRTGNGRGREMFIMVTGWFPGNRIRFQWRPKLIPCLQIVKSQNIVGFT